MNKLYIHTEKCRVESDYIKRFKIFSEGIKGDTIYEKEISVIGVPMDLGQMRRGVDMGPSAIRYAGVIERIEEIGYDVKDMGDICIEREKR